MGIESGPMDYPDERARGGGAADTGLEQNGIARDQRLDELHTRQEQRVVARTDDEDNTDRLTADFTAHAGEPEGQTAATEPTWRENQFRFAFEEPARFGKRKHLGRERFECGTLPCRGRSFG